MLGILALIAILLLIIIIFVILFGSDDDNSDCDSEMDARTHPHHAYGRPYRYKDDYSERDYDRPYRYGDGYSERDYRYPDDDDFAYRYPSRSTDLF
jgi:hypothetical protein